jgi:hypothetical protein
VFPGADQSLHWDLEDPAEVEGSDADRAAAFRATYAELRRRIGGFVEMVDAALAASVQDGTQRQRRSMKPKSRT